MSSAFFKAFVIGLLATGLGLGLLGLGGACQLLVPSPPPNALRPPSILSTWPADGNASERAPNMFVRSASRPMTPSSSTAMKLRGPGDTLAGYEERLRKPRRAQGREGNAEIVSVGRVKIAGAEWVEGVLIDSEVPNYETTLPCRQHRRSRDPARHFQRPQGVSPAPGAPGLAGYDR